MSIFPQVLLLGNGINIAYGGASWNELLKRITKNKDLLKLDLKSPMPLRAVLLTGSHIKGAMKTEKEHLMGRIDNEQQKAYYRSLLAAGFDHILTTNYSYELEIASADKEEIKESALKKMLSHTEMAKAAEPKYMLHTYYDCTFDSHQNRIWHIHGEARKPDSMVLGHYYYGSLFSKIKEYLDKREIIIPKTRKKEKPRRSTAGSMHSFLAMYMCLVSAMTYLNSTSGGCWSANPEKRRKRENFSTSLPQAKNLMRKRRF